MSFLIWGGVFIISLTILVKSADKFVDSATRIGAMLKAPEFVVGITLVALGTSLPELATSLVAAGRGQTEFILGNAVGSNVANVLLILGLTVMIFRRTAFKRDMASLDLPFFFLSAFLLTLFVVTGRSVSRAEALFLLPLYLVYLGLLFSGHRPAEPGPKSAVARTPFLWLFVSGAGIYFGADFTLKATINLSRLFGLGDTSVLALTAVAVGTSLPELVVSLIAARRRALDLAVGNIIGSNIFNSLLVVGVPAVFMPLSAPKSVVDLGLPFMAGATLACCLVLVRRGMGRVMATIFLLAFALFLVGLFRLG